MKADLRYAVRMLLKSPVFTGVAVLTLALGIGANTSVFSVVRHVLLKSLPYRDADRLVTIWLHDPEHGFPKDIMSYPRFQETRNLPEPSRMPPPLPTPPSCSAGSMSRSSFGARK